MWVLSQWLCAVRGRFDCPHTVASDSGKNTSLSCCERTDGHWHKDCVSASVSANASLFINADSIQRGSSRNSLLPVHQPRVSTAGKRLAHKHANKRLPSDALQLFKVFGVRGHAGTRARARTRAKREDERMVFSWLFEGKKKNVPDQTMVAVEARELCQWAAERQRAGRLGYLARGQQVTCEESQWGTTQAAAWTVEWFNISLLFTFHLEPHK